MLLSLIGGVATILASWFFLSACLVGVGLLPGRVLRLDTLDSHVLLQAFWFGVGLVTLSIHVWHFAFPVTWHLLALVVVAGLVGLYRNRAELRRLLVEDSRLAGVWVPALVVLLIGAWLAHRATAPCCAYDTAANHLLVVRWSQAHAVVPGIANLYGELGFNNSSLLFAALIDTGPWSGVGHHIVNGLLLYAFLGAAAVAGVALWRGRGPAPVHVFRLVLVAPAIVFALRPQISSYNTNLAGTIVAAAGATEAFRYLIERARGGVRGSYALIATTTILVTAACFKLNVAVFAAGAIAVLLLLWVRTGGWKEVTSRRRVAIGIATAVLGLGFTWAARGVILSGYPAYPNTALSVPVPWKAPTEQALATEAWIRYAGRVITWAGASEMVDYRLGLDGRWIGPWTQHVFLRPRDLTEAVPNGTWSIALPTVLIGAAGLLWLVGRGRRRDPARRERWVAWWLLPAILIGIGFWFWAAPQPRLGLGLAWVLAALCLARLAPDPNSQLSSRVRRSALAGLVLLGTMPAWLPLSTTILSGRSGLVSALIEHRLIQRPPAPAVGWFHPTPAPRLSRYVTSSGLELWVPAGERDVRCWDAPLPCTPHPAPNLRLRHPPDLGAGFETNGSWQAERWPVPWLPFGDSWRQHRRR